MNQSKSSLYLVLSSGIAPEKNPEFKIPSGIPLFVLADLTFPKAGDIF